MCDLCDPAIKNEQKWIDIALHASKLLERAGLTLPEGDLREECLALHAEIQTTPLYNYKGKAVTSDYAALKKHGCYALECAQGLF